MKTNEKEIFDVSKNKERKILNDCRYEKLFGNNINNLSNSFYNDSLIKNIKEQIKMKTFNEKYIKLKVILLYSYQPSYLEFYIPTKVKLNDNFCYQFCLKDIIDSINTYKNKKTVFLDESYLISYYINDENDFNFYKNPIKIVKDYYLVGNYPLNDNIDYYIDLPNDLTLYLKLRKIISKEQTLRYDIFESERGGSLEESDSQNKDLDKLNVNIKSKRAKEKKIGFVIRKVFEWKMLRTLSNSKISLVESAKNLGISKKSLDEYLYQIKGGYKYHFDFTKHQNDKINVLRSFVKIKEEESKLNNGNTNTKIHVYLENKRFRSNY